MSARVGVSSLDFSFDIGVPLAGFAARTAPSSGVHDPVGARALCVEQDDTATITVVADLTSIAPEDTLAVRRRIADETSVPLEAIAVLATHTHSAPNLDPWMTMPAAPRDMWASTEHTLVSAGVDAWNTRCDATMAFAAAPVQLAVNRRRADGPVDDMLSVVRFDRAEDGAPLAVLFSYACHPTVIGASNTLVSSDWPAAARARVEEAFPGAYAVFFQGFCGDCNVGHSAHASMDISAPTNRTPAEAVRIGTRIGEAVVRTARRAETVTGPVRAKTATYLWSWTNSDAKEPLDYGTETDAASRTMAELSREWRRRMDEHRDETTEALSVACASWGPIVLVLVSGEPFAELGLSIRRLLPDAHVIPVGYANGVPGYLPYPSNELPLGGYEVDEAFLPFGRPTSVPLEFAEFALNAVVEFSNAPAA